MKRMFWVLTAAMVWAFTAQAQQAATGTPKIKLDTLVYDFGKTSMVQQLTGKFIITNEGDGVLELKKPQPTCGCTVPALKTDKLAPGESTEMNFTFNVGTPRGLAEKHIGLPSNDPNQPNVRLTLRVEMVPTFDVIPAVAVLGNVRQGTVTNLTVEIKRLDGKPLGLDRVESTQNTTRARLEPVEGTTDTARLHVEVDAGGTPRYFNDSVRLFAGDAQQPALTVPVTGRIVGDVTANPEAQFWGIADPDNWPGARPEQQQRRFSIVLNRSDAVLEIKKATTDLSDVKVDVRPIEEGRVYEVVATLEKAPKQSERGTIKVETNLASLELGLTVNVLKRN